MDTRWYDWSSSLFQKLHKLSWVLDPSSCHFSYELYFAKSNMSPPEITCQKVLWRLDLVSLHTASRSKGISIFVVSHTLLTHLFDFCSRRTRVIHTTSFLKLSGRLDFPWRQFAFLGKFFFFTIITPVYSYWRFTVLTATDFSKPQHTNFTQKKSPFLQSLFPRSIHRRNINWQHCRNIEQVHNQWELSVVHTSELQRMTTRPTTDTTEMWRFSMSNATTSVGVSTEGATSLSSSSPVERELTRTYSLSPDHTSTNRTWFVTLPRTLSRWDFLDESSRCVRWHL